MLITGLLVVALSTFLPLSTTGDPTLPPTPVTIDIGMLSYRMDYPAPGPSILMAIEDFQRQGRLPGVTFNLWDYRSGCSSKRAVYGVMDMVEFHDIDVLFGERCGSVCEVVGYYMSKLGLPFLPTGCTSASISNKVTYNTVIRLAPSFDKIAMAVIEIFKSFGWSTTSVYQAYGGACGPGMIAMRDALRRHDVTIAEWLDMDVQTEDEYRNLLQRLRSRARIFITCGTFEKIAPLMDAADKMGMTNGEFVFIFFYLYVPHQNINTPWQFLAPLGELEKHDMAKTRRIFTSAKIVTIADFTVEKEKNFTDLVNWRLGQPPFNITERSTSLDAYSMFLYDAASLYLTLLERALATSESYRNGTRMMQLAQDYTFTGQTGDVHMNADADRLPEFWLWQLPEHVDSFEPVAFIDIVHNDTQNRVKLLDTPNWGSGSPLPPAAVPACGFNQERCPLFASTNILVIALSLGLVSVCSAVLATYLWRRRRLERDLQLMTWRVFHEDIQPLNPHHTSYDSVDKSNRSGLNSLHSVSSDNVNGIRQIFGRLAMWKGNVVSIKKSEVDSVVMDRDFLVAMRQLKILQHDNLVQFVGACVDAPNITVLTTYCSKGSLQDIIHNDDITLDWLFKSSLISDIISGLAYVHASFVGSHGRLNSLNCLVDGRWVLRIADVGLAYFRPKPGNPDVVILAQDDLWTAPELLRRPEVERPRYGSQAGDVYSFGVILQETVHRALPYFDELPAEEVVRRVVAGPAGDVAPPYRPQCPSEEDGPLSVPLTRLMQDCWQEDPDVRPSFVTIGKTFRRINKGKKPNILDNMIRMLEKYANNLEDIVNQRTMELQDEKKRTEMLLLRMLPRSVADRLKVGQTVDPELFDSVTIYFSDIVGFTALSAASSPFEIVQFLNDLYTVFDRTIEKYDVYKVETIGDAYMVVSGLPQRNSGRHVTEVVEMSLALQNEVANFRAAHKPDYELKLRIGLHTGPCAAGVVGLAMPRYCLFGDTVNMASRMESTGEALRIHVSETTAEGLRRVGGYGLEARGDTEVKGKGMVTTYWLCEKNASIGK